MKKKTGLVFFPAFDYAITPTHPEREERLLYTQDQVVEEGLLDFDNIKEYKPDLATPEDINRVHFCVPNIDEIVHTSHLISVGGTLTAADQGHDRRSGQRFRAGSSLRTPFHACRARQPWFLYAEHGSDHDRVHPSQIRCETDCCGRYRLPSRRRFADIFWHDPNTLFISMHQDGRTLYPGSGFPDEMGGPNAFGSIVNLPMPPETCEEGFLYTLDNIVMPLLDDFKPDLIINSAGQDNHYSDPITNMKFTAQGYAVLNDRLKPDLAVLEGGYSIESALPYINTGIILAMAGMDYSHIKEPDYDPRNQVQSQHITNYLKQLKDHTLDNWRNKEAIKQQFLPESAVPSSQPQHFLRYRLYPRNPDRSRQTVSDCGGTVVIDSQADSGRDSHIKAVAIPRYACDACRKWGEEQFEKGKKEGFAQVFLQDKDKDLYLVDE